MAGDIVMPRRRASRLKLYAPFLVLAILAVAWSVAWLVIRGRVASGLDEWIAAEATKNRRWSCADRTVGGYPFRIEIACASLSLARPDADAELGRLHVVTQVYDPGHVIAEVSGPLRVTAGPTSILSTWRLLRLSVITKAGAQRASFVADEPTIRIESPEAAPIAVTGRRLEIHLRPGPADPTTADLALTASAAVVPGLDGLIGGAEPADLEFRLGVTHAYDLPVRPLLNELEGWRLAGGRIGFERLVVAKGARRIEAKGSGMLDELHRPAGQLDLAATPLEGLLGRITGGRAGLAGGLLGTLLGAPAAGIAQPDGTRDPRLRPLPPLKLEGGRLAIGPLTVPGFRLGPLY